jgi:hypothetical protein
MARRLPSRGDIADRGNLLSMAFTQAVGQLARKRKK